MVDGDAAQVLGLVLAGGRSERFGRDKAALALDGETLLRRAVRVLRQVVPDTYVAVRPDQLDDDTRREFTLIADEKGNIGPAAGLLAAHRAVPGGAWLVLACDMPLVHQGLLQFLLARRDPARGATAFRCAADSRPEPLCAIYEPATLARFRVQVEAGGDSSLRRWLADAGSLLLDLPESGVLESVNTPQDLERMAAGNRSGGQGPSGSRREGPKE